MSLTVLICLIVLVNTVRANDAQTDLLRLQRVLAEHPTDALAHYQLGLTYRELGDNRNATLNLQAAISEGFDNLGAKLNLIEAAFACRESTLALETAKQVLSPSLKSPDVLLRVGNQLFDHLFYKESLRAFTLAELAAPAAFEPRFRVALTNYLLEDYSATVAALKSSPEAESSPEAISLRASAEAKLGDIQRAASVLRRSIEINPASPHAYINLALIELDRGNDDAAKTLLEQLRVLKTRTSAKVFYTVSRNACRKLADVAAQEDAPAHTSIGEGEFYYQLGSQLLESFNFMSAVELLRLARENEGNSARIMLAAGASCLNYDPLAAEPIVLLRQAIARDGNLHKAYYLLGRSYTRQGQLENAIAAYRKAAELHPDASYFVALGKVLQNPRDSIAAFEQALKIDPTCAQAHFELGRIHMQLNELDKARPELQKAIEQEPDYYEAYYLLGRLLHRLGDEQQSHELLTQFEEKKNALLQQSVIGAGFASDDR